MKLNKTDYVLERASDGGYYAWLTVNMQCNAYGESPEEAVLNFIIDLFNTQFINNVRGPCIFIFNYYGISDIYTGGTL